MSSPRASTRILLTLLALVPAAHAQEPASQASAPLEAQAAPPTVSEVEARIAALEGTDSPEAARWSEALAALRRAEADAATAERFGQEAAGVPARIEALRAELEAAAHEPELSAAGLETSEVETRAAGADAELKAAREEAGELDQLGQLRTARMAELPIEIAAALAAAEDARRELGGLPSTADQAAQRALLAARAEAGARRAAALQAELASYEALRELLPLRRDLVARRVARAQRAADFWEAAARQRSELENRRAVDATGRRLDELVARFPALAPLADENRALNELRTGPDGLPARIAEAHDGLEEIRQQLAATREHFRAATRRMAVGGLTGATAITLRHDFDWLPREQVLSQQAEARERLLSQAQLQAIGIEEDRAALTDLPQAVTGLLRELGVQDPDDELQAAALELVSDTRQAQDAALAALETLTAELFEQRRLGAELDATVEAYRDFIERHILWVRSTALDPLPALLAVPGDARQVAGALAGPAAETARRTLRDHPAEGLLVAALLAALVAGRGYLKRKREEMAQLARSYRTDHFLLTVRALVQTLLLSLPLPLTAWALARLLEPSSDELVRAFSSGLDEIARVWLVLRFWSSLLAEKSVGPAHFRWPSPGLVALRRELSWYEPCAVVLGLVAFSLDRQSALELSASLGRLCFVLWTLASSVLAYRLLCGEVSFWKLTFPPGRGLLGRTHRIWSTVLTIFPLGLAVLSALGYDYTARQFQLHLRYSTLFALALLLVNALLLRWLFITRRRLAVSQALEERARRQKEIEASVAAGAIPSESEKLDADKVDIPAVDARTRQLFKSSMTLASMLGLYLIWASALPALQGLDRVQILPRPALLPAEPEPSPAWPGAVPAAPGAAAGAPAGSAQAPPTGQGTGSPGGTPAAPSGTGGTAGAPLLPLPSATPALTQGSDQAAPAAGAPSEALPTLTLAGLLVAILILLLTNLAARNLPALIELALLQRLPLDSGARYAVTTILRYLILIAGVSALSTAIGIGWRDVQWLVAALTFGLAFGLQEIFANFVSGLIILLERPVRVGDIVTVGGTEGRVTQLRMRATTILDWDRRELLVPNKEFITSSVINWTLSDPITRLVIRVGIAYGSDTALARELLLEVARENRSVLGDPPPSALFVGFGDSTLNFELRVFFANRDLWPALIDALHTAIDEAFRRAGVEIAFPQRDLHIRSAEGLTTLAPRGQPGSEG